MKKFLLISLLISIFLLSDCSRTQIGWSSTNIGDTFQAAYRRFDGREVETLRLDTGDNFTLHYDIEVSAGSLKLEIVDPEGQAVWEENFTQDAQSSTELTVEESGRYQIIAAGKDTEGGFDLNWEILD